MQISDVEQLSPREIFHYWIEERIHIKLARQRMATKPWTNDEILQSYRFCNARRMDDKVSRWLLENWYRPFHGHKNMVVAVALARFINKPESLEAVKFPQVWSPSQIKETLRALKDSGQTIFNGAYMVRGNDGEDKVSSVVDFYVNPMYESPPGINPASMRISHESLMQYHGMGSFMAGQIVADLRWAMPGAWADKRKWAPLGPGSARGMNRLYEQPLKASLSQEEFEEKLDETMTLCRTSMDRNLTAKLEAHDYQNCLCEYDKYCRVLYKEGFPKQKYQGI